MLLSGNRSTPGDKASFESQERPPTSSSCLEFYYFMNGEGVGALRVLLRRVGLGNVHSDDLLFTLKGGQGPRWRRELVEVKELQFNWKVSETQMSVHPLITTDCGRLPREWHIDRGPSVLALHGR